MTWESFDPYPEYPALWSLRSGCVLVACRRYLAGQFRLQVSIDHGHGHGWALSITSPEF